MLRAPMNRPQPWAVLYQDLLLWREAQHQSPLLKIGSRWKTSSAVARQEKTFLKIGSRLNQRTIFWRVVLATRTSTSSHFGRKDYGAIRACSHTRRLLQAGALPEAL